jgi:uncharacterized protein
MDLPVGISQELIDYIKKTYVLHWNGIHGYAHWVRVYENGMRLAGLNGANQLVVTLFAFTHDMARQNDGADYQHGPRAAERIRTELQGRFFQLPSADLTLLTEAVRLHTAGLVDADLTVQTCWDSDRLDLARAGITPSLARLCTPQARDPEIIAWAVDRSINYRS